MSLIPRNCLSMMLDRCTTHPGYAVFRASDHTDLALHCLHVGPDGLWHYAPGATLGHPVQALCGFDGVVWDRDMADAPPMSVRSIVVGSTLLCIGVYAWAISRCWRRVVRRIEKTDRADQGDSR